MSEERTYRVVVTREDGAWLADVPELEGAHTYARNLPALDQSVREVIAMVEDLPDGAEDGLKIAYEYHTGDPKLDEAAAQLRATRDRVLAEKQQVERQTVELAREMVSAHSMSVRDAAALIGVAPQRISQVAPRKAVASPAVHKALRKLSGKSPASGQWSAQKNPISSTKVDRDAPHSSAR